MNKKGFTLIELMIVVVIIGILAAIAIPNFISMQDRAKEGSVKSNMHTIQLAVEDYAVQNVGNYSEQAAFVTEALDGDGINDANVGNPFDNSVVGLVAGSATVSGHTGYLHTAYGSTNYTITGWGKDGILLDASGGTFILSNQN